MVGNNMEYYLHCSAVIIKDATEKKQNIWKNEKVIKLNYKKRDVKSLILVFKIVISSFEEEKIR